MYRENNHLMLLVYFRSNLVWVLLSMERDSYHFKKYITIKLTKNAYRLLLQFIEEKTRSPVAR